MAARKTAPEKPISTVEELMARLDKLGDGDFIYRGQANANWHLKSGAVRRVQGKTKADSDQYPAPDEVQNYIFDLVGDAKSLGLEFHGGTKGNCCALKVLAELQHHGAATNLLDFSRNVLVALWMVCSEEFDQDGKIFVANLRDVEFEKLSVDDAEIITIPKLFLKPKIQVWTPERFVARIQSQSSVFLIAPDESRIECATILVNKSCKKELLEKLANRFSLTEVQVYPDLPGFARANRALMPCYDRHANHYVDEAEKATENNDLESARQLFDKAAKVGPEDAYVFFKRALFRGKHNNPTGAIEDYGTALKLKPKFSAAYNNRGILRSDQGDTAGAMTDYDTAIKLNPNYASAYNNRGVLRKAQGDLKDAREDYDKAIELKPDYADAHYNRGILRKAQGDLKGAREDYDKATELNPYYADAYYNRGNLKSDQGDLAGAMADYDMAIKLKPDYAEVYNNRGVLRSDQGDLAGAMADYDRALELNSDYANAYLNKALLLEEMGKIPEAIVCCKTYIRLKPDNPDGPTLLTRLEKKLKG